MDNKTPTLDFTIIEVSVMLAALGYLRAAIQAQLLTYKGGSDKINLADLDSAMAKINALKEQRH